jgi:hypothetical protein
VYWAQLKDLSQGDDIEKVFNDDEDEFDDE